MKDSKKELLSACPKLIKNTKGLDPEKGKLLGRIDPMPHYEQ